MECKTEIQIGIVRMVIKHTLQYDNAQDENEKYDALLIYICIVQHSII